LQTESYIHNEAAILAREDKKLTAENKILNREIENLRETIFKEKRKRKRRKALNFYKEDEMEIRTLFFSPAKVARARERAAALKKAESQ
jgi:cell division protein FtsB